MDTFKKDKLTVKICDSRAELGKVAAADISACFKKLLAEKERINVIFAAAPSQSETLSALVADQSVEWNRINAYHMDEYVGLDENAPQLFGNFLKRALFSRVSFASVNYIDGTAQDTEREIARYSRLIRSNPPDAVVLGIGENGHIAFNNPPEARFDDEAIMKKVRLDEISRNQQVNDGCFEKIGDVPYYALTLTIPALVSAAHLFCAVPARTKARAVKDTLLGPVDERCPASILRRQEDATLYLDRDSSAMLYE